MTNNVADITHDKSHLITRKHPVQNGWRIAFLREDIDLISGQHLLPTEYNVEGAGLPYLTGPTDFIDGKISPTKFTKAPKAICEAGDILLTVKGSGTGKSIVADQSYCISRQLMAVRTKQWDSNFIFYCLQRKQSDYESASAGLIPGISRDHVLETEIPLPPLPEQRKIARILGAWDRAIELTTKLIESKQQRKRGLMQQLLTGGLRFPGFEDHLWIEVHIGDVLVEVDRRILWDDASLYRLISIRRRSVGLFFREALYGYEIKTKNMNLAVEGDFLISKMQVVHGATGLVTEEFDGMHYSDSYLSLVSRDKSCLDVGFFSWLAKLPQLYRIALMSSYGVHIEKMTFNLDDYLRHKIWIPASVTEQRRIAAILSLCDMEIDTLKDQLEAMKRQKKGLMARLLTGKLRVIP